MRFCVWGNSLATEVVLLRKLGRYEVKNSIRPFVKILLLVITTFGRFSESTRFGDALVEQLVGESDWGRDREIYPPTLPQQNFEFIF
ncbi:MAG: hypothetical protein LBQ66_05745 [Planctomycetaceae bacterium]|jgi:hypothetical protein|nr:hypothetical protein [Planctomycetaceae bacterium]